MKTIGCVVLVVWLAACAHEGPTHAGAQPEMTPPSGAESPAADGVPDPLVTDPDHYALVTESPRVRVLRYHDTPGAKTHQHHHPDAVLYALSAFHRRLIFPNGKVVEREFKAGDVMWIPAQTHVGENIGTTETEVLLVELK